MSSILVCRYNPKDSTRELLALINTLGKVVGYAINVQNSVAFLYINDTQLKTRGTTSFTITSKVIKLPYTNFSNSISCIFPPLCSAMSSWQLKNAMAEVFTQESMNAIHPVACFSAMLADSNLPV